MDRTEQLNRRLHHVLPTIDGDFTSGLTFGTWGCPGLSFTHVML